MRLQKILVLTVMLCIWAIAAQGEPIPSTGNVEVFFSPRGGATEEIVREIMSARQEVLIQAYSFTSKPIAKALLDARRRGVIIEAVLDKSNATAKYSAATFLVNAGIPVFIDGKHAIAHNKVIVIDRSTLITGSFNFTAAAENKNAENMLVIKGNQKLTDQYILNYKEHKRHSSLYVK